jgi:hypothetical protein
VVLRDMAQGEQAQLSLEEAIRKLKG